MSNTNNTTNNVTVNAPVITPEAKKAEEIFVPIQDAIIAACELGNRHALTALEAACAGATQEAFSKWRFWVEQLRTACIEYGKKADAQATPDDRLALAKARVLEKWRELVSVGNSGKVHPNMFLRETDADTLRVYACNISSMNVPGLGSVQVVTPAPYFRKMVELFLGLRMRASEALSDIDRDVISAYISAQNSKAKAEEQLNGKEQNGQHIDGLNKQLEDIKENIKKSFELLESVGVTKEQALANPAIVAILAVEKQIESAIATANKTIEDADKVIKEKEDIYKKIVSNINRIEKIDQSASPVGIR